MRETVIPNLDAGGIDVVFAGHSHGYEQSYLLDGAYGYGTAPNFATPSFNTLLADGHILDAGNGNPTGNEAYQKYSGGTSHDGTVYVVSGHGIDPTGNHPVMAMIDLAFGSVLLDINCSTLTLRNLRSGGGINDTVVIEKFLLAVVAALTLRMSMAIKKRTSCGAIPVMAPRRCG